MSLLINQNLFKHREVTTANLNNLCTIMHKLTAEGVYSGQVFADTNLLGTFQVTYTKSNPAQQAQIDLSSFDSFVQINLKKKAFTTPPSFLVGQDGIVIFFISGAQTNLYATLADSTSKQVFDSRDLDKGDAAVFRLMAVGNYVVTDTAGQTLGLTVKAAENGAYPHLSDQPPVIINLDANGFTPANAAVNPLQVLIVSIAIPTSLALTTA